MTKAQIARYRVQNQQIANKAHATPAVVLKDIVALQAQDYAGAKWSLGLRVPASTEGTIEQAIASKHIVRTWSFRGTLHFMHPDNLRGILALIAPRLLTKAGTNFRKHGMDKDGTFPKSHKIITKALQGGKKMTRAELIDVLAAKRVNTEGLRAGFILLEASLHGLLCQGPREGREFTFVLLDEWLPQASTLLREETIIMLAQKYFKSHGPASLSDFIYWSGLTMADAKQGLSAVSKDLDSITVHGIEYWMPKDMPPLSKTTSVYLLPGFDEYILGYNGRALILDPHHNKKVVGSNNGFFNPTIIIDGIVEGTWKRTIKKDKVTIEIFPFTNFSSTIEKKIATAAGAYGAFLQMEHELVFPA